MSMILRNGKVVSSLVSLKEKIFERFYQAQEGDQRSFGGLGIGLSIVKSIAEAHGGEILVSSRPNHGSTFQMILPDAAPGETTPA